MKMCRFRVQNGVFNRYASKYHILCRMEREHASEGFMPLRSIVFEIWTRQTKNSWNFRKFDIWPVITGSNIDLGPNIISPIASTRRANLLVFSAKLYDVRLETSRGGGRPPTPAKVAKHGLRARVKLWKLTRHRREMETARSCFRFCIYCFLPICFWSS